MRSKKTVSLPHSSRVCEKGYNVSVDFFGPFEPDVDGNTQSSVVSPTRESFLDWKSLSDYVRIDCGEFMVSNPSRLNISIHLV